MPKTPTKRAYDDLDAACDYFNKQLFGSRLPLCLITVRPHRGAYGSFSGERFGSRDGKEITDETALNIKTFPQRSQLEILSTLVHEMVHCEQFHFGEPSRNGYHNKQWAAWMKRIGLMPSDSGAPGGKRTGQRMSHYVAPNGPFAAVAKRKFTVPYFDRVAEGSVTRGKLKITYTCPSCDDKVWGKPDVQPHCGKCGLERRCHRRQTAATVSVRWVRAATAGRCSRGPPSARLQSLEITIPRPGGGRKISRDRSSRTACAPKFC